jgi:hypothetical protein
VSVMRPRAEVAEFPWRFHLGDFTLAMVSWYLVERAYFGGASGSRSKPLSLDGMSRSAAASAQQIHHEAGTPDNAVKLPGPDDPITIERNPNRVVVSVAGRVIARTRNALMLREAAHSKVGPD